MEKMDKHQRKAIKMALDENGVSKLYITGAGGTGKSMIIDKITSKIKDCIVLAPTNSAAKNINGETIHSFFKIRANITEMAKKEEDVLWFNLKIKDTNYKNKVFIIDEISMVGKKSLEGWVKKLKVKKLILFGDPEQLRPVKDLSVDWSKFCDTTVKLKKNYRAINKELNEIIKYYRNKKIINPKIETFKSTDIFNLNNTVCLAHENKKLSELQERLIGYRGLREGDRAILSGAIKDSDYKNGDSVTVISQDMKFDINGLERWTIGLNKKKYPAYIITGDYDIYQATLTARQNRLKAIKSEFGKKYNIDPEKVRTGGNGKFASVASDEDLEKLRPIATSYWHLKFTPYARHKNFVTIHKSQGKSYTNVVACIKNADSQLIYVAISRARESLKLIV